MITHISGILEHKDLNYIIVDVQGIGYKIFVSSAVIDQLPAHGEKIKIFTEQIVREDSVSLYGFSRREEKNLFASLLTVSGVGPQSAKGMISNIPLDRLVAGITQGNAELLSSAPGIGQKTAQRIIIELKEKLTKAYGSTFSPIEGKAHGDNTFISDAISALMTLGLNPREAREAVTKLNHEDLKSTEDIIKAALKALG